MNRPDPVDQSQAEDILELSEPAYDVPPAIGNDERRMHVRAYNYWTSLLGGRGFPSIADLDPHSLDDFGPYSVLLDFTKSREIPDIAFVGHNLREECGIDRRMKSIEDVPSRSLLSRLTDHYFQIIANRAPIGFEAEFVSQRGTSTMYRGILMPFSSDGTAIDYIYGVINWKELADSETAAELVLEMRDAAEAPARSDQPIATPIWADGPRASHLLARHGDDSADQETDEEYDFAPHAGAELSELLAMARESANAVREADGRSRRALYRALGRAYDFYLASQTDSAAYHTLLEDAGLKVQDRAPMTPVVKLIFGADYDKTRLTEFASALTHGARHDIARGEFGAFIEDYPGGLKGLVQAERLIRHPSARQAKERSAPVREWLRHAPIAAKLPLAATDEEFVLLVARREADGMLAVVDSVPHDRTLMERALLSIPCPAVDKAA